MLKLFLFSTLVIKQSHGFLDPTVAPWLFFVHPKTQLSPPISTFDKSQCDYSKPVEFQGCHGTLIHKRVILITKSCLDEQGIFGMEPLPFLLGTGMYDDLDQEHETLEIGPTQYQILPFSFNQKFRHLPELVMIRAKQPVEPKYTPLPIADFVPLAEDLNNDCRIFGCNPFNNIQK